MTIMDKENQFFTAFAPTTVATHVVDSGQDVIDLSPFGGTPTANLGRNLGPGEELWLQILVQTAATSGGAATVDFQLVTDSVAAMSSTATLASTGAKAVAALTAGKMFYIRLPRPDSIPAGGAGVVPYEQFLGCAIVIATAALTAGAFQAAIVRKPQDNRSYAGGYRVA